MAGSLLRRVLGVASLAIGLSIAVAAPASANTTIQNVHTHSSYVRPADWWWGP